jgi:hypothetical protein
MDHKSNISKIIKFVYFATKECLNEIPILKKFLIDFDVQILSIITKDRDYPKSILNEFFEKIPEMIKGTKL